MIQKNTTKLINYLSLGNTYSSPCYVGLAYKAHNLVPRIGRSFSSSSLRSIRGGKGGGLDSKTYSKFIHAYKEHFPVKLNKNWFDGLDYQAIKGGFVGFRVAEISNCPSIDVKDFSVMYLYDRFYAYSSKNTEYFVLVYISGTDRCFYRTNDIIYHKVLDGSIPGCSKIYTDICLNIIDFGLSSDGYPEYDDDFKIGLMFIVVEGDKCESKK